MTAVTRDLIASVVNERVKALRPDLASAGLTLREEDLRMSIKPTVLAPRDVSTAQKIDEYFRTLSEVDLGRYVRAATPIYLRYLNSQADTSGAPLMLIAYHAFQAVVVGLARGGGKLAVQGAAEQHRLFDEKLLMAVNAELFVVRAEAKAESDRREQHVQSLIAQADQEMKADYARCVTDLNTRKEELDAREATLREQVEADLQMALRAADQAQADASEARRQLDAASAQLTRERAAHEQALAELRRTLAAERAATINRDRDTRNQIHQLEQDRRNLSSTVGHLNRECERLEAELATARTATPEPAPTSAPAALEVTVMPEPTPNPRLAAMSCAVYLTAHGIPTRANGTRIETQEVQSIPPALVQAWETEYPTDEARRAHLRASIRPLLAQDAA